MVGASKDSVIMVEGEMEEISEKEMIEAKENGFLEYQETNQKQFALFEKLTNDYENLKINLETQFQNWQNLKFNDPFLAPQKMTSSI